MIRDNSTKPLYTIQPAPVPYGLGRNDSSTDGDFPNRHQRRGVEARRLKEIRRQVKTAQVIENRRHAKCLERGEASRRKVFIRPELETTEFRKGLLKITRPDPPISAEAITFGVGDDIKMLRNIRKRLNRSRR